MSINNYLTLHFNKNEFRSAIEYTAAQTGFRPELIEKDYYCTVALQYIFSHNNHFLVFKGGTLLAKCHAGFYRLSEDLDFTLPASPLSTRTQRSNKIQSAKKIIANIENALPIFKVHVPLTGSNNSMQYNGVLTYHSILSYNEERILLEIGLREELLKPAVTLSVNTLLLNPFSGLAFVPLIKTRCLTKEEAYAEKIRAALTRNRLAIRDFYDIDHAAKHSLIDLESAEFLKLVFTKIESTKDRFIIYDKLARNSLNKKLHTELAPTLKGGSFTGFDLDGVLNMLEKILQNKHSPIL